MSKLTYINIVGKNYPLSFSLGASKRLVEKFGSFEKMEKALNKNGSDLEKMETISYILELLIAQGCAYKNHFEKDIPATDTDPVIDGKWTPLTREVIDIAIQIEDMKGLSDKIMECMKNGGKKDVEVKPDKKI